MIFRVYLDIQDDKDWVINSYQDEENLVNEPSMPYVRIECTLVQLTSAMLNGLHVRGLAPFVQNHLATSPGHVNMALNDFAGYQSAT